MPTTSLNDDITELKELPATMHNPEEDIINQQEYDKWLTNIEKLKEDYKVVAKMNLIDNFGYKEIADALDMPLNTVKTKIRRAKAQLLKMMEYSDELLYLSSRACLTVIPSLFNCHPELVEGSNTDKK